MLSSVSADGKIIEPGGGLGDLRQGISLDFTETTIIL